MAQGSHKGSEPDLTSLVQSVVSDAERLLGQHVELLRSEVRQEIHRAKTAAAALGVGAGLVAAGGALGTLTAVHWLHRSTRLPLWGCYGVVGGLLGAAGVGLLGAGRRRAAGLRLGAPQTAAAVKENLTWLKEQAARAPA